MTFMNNVGVEIRIGRLKMEKSEYEIQHFGFSAKQMSLQRRVVMKNYLSQLLSSALQSFTKNEHISKETMEELLSQRNEIIEKVFVTFEPKLQEIDALDEKNFSIPDNVLLYQDFGQEKCYKQADEDNLNAEIEALKTACIENSIMIASLEMENSKYAEIEKLVEKELVIHDLVQKAISTVDLDQTSAMVANVLDTLSQTESE